MENGRPNIRIEIQNTVTEPMDVDKDENEEGEIVDSTETTVKQSIIPVNHTKNWLNSQEGFSPDADIFCKDAKEKLVERAKRFGLKPDEVQNFVEEDLQNLYASLGVTFENEKEIRFKAVHMRGTGEMSTEDIFEYFRKYGPIYMEWITDDSCNVVWKDKLSAARALHFTSKPVKGMPARGSSNQFVKEFDIPELQEEDDDENKGHSILLKNREVELQKEDSEENKENSKDCVHITDIKVPIPPGYWRLGLEHPKSRGILLRFSMISDKRPLAAEKFSEYYKKYGNPNYKGMQGLISEHKRKKIRGIFDRNKEISQGNPWGVLAKTWHKDAKFCEKEYKATPAEPAVRNSTDKTSIMNRLGFKRAHGNVEKDKEVEEEDEPEEKTTEVSEPTRKKVKFPRMKMYADEEEEKLKHKRKMKISDSQSKKPQEKQEENDLRKFLESGRKTANKIPVIDITDDLGDKLMNRRDAREELLEKKHQSIIIPQKNTLRSDIILERKKYASPVRNLAPTYSEKSRKHHIRHSGSHQGMYHESRHRRKKSSHHSLENLDTSRTQSKVAVVVKKQKKPSVASTVWARINDARKSSKSKFKGRSTSTSNSSSESESSSESSSSSSSSSSNSQSSSSSESDEEESDNDNSVTQRFKQIKAEVHRPGFTHINIGHNHKSPSPLRIEIKNDRFKQSKKT